MKCKCGSKYLDKGRAFDGRRAYRCKVCETVWTYGMQGRERDYSPQRQGNQFHDTGASNQSVLPALNPRLTK